RFTPGSYVVRKYKGQMLLETTTAKLPGNSQFVIRVPNANALTHGGKDELPSPVPKVAPAPKVEPAPRGDTAEELRADVSFLEAKLKQVQDLAAKKVASQGEVRAAEIALLNVRIKLAEAEKKPDEQIKFLKQLVGKHEEQVNVLKQLVGAKV